MNYYNTNTGEYPYSKKDIKRDNPRVSYKFPLHADVMAELGLVVPGSVPRPAIDETTQKAVLKTQPEFVDGEWVLGWDVINFSADKIEIEAFRKKQALLDMVAARREFVEEKGIQVGETFISTTHSARAATVGALLSMSLLPAEQQKVRDWKTKGSFKQVTKSDLEQSVILAFNHVEACYTKESELASAIEAGTFTDEMFNTGWPNVPDEEWLVDESIV